MKIKKNGGGGAKRRFALRLPSCSTMRVFTGVADIAAYCLYINRIARTTFAANLAPGVLRYNSTTTLALSVTDVIGQIC